MNKYDKHRVVNYKKLMRMGYRKRTAKRKLREYYDNFATWIKFRWNQDGTELTEYGKEQVEKNFSTGVWKR